MNRWIEAFDQLNDVDLFADREVHHTGRPAPAPLNKPAKPEPESSLGKQTVDDMVSPSTAFPSKAIK